MKINYVGKIAAGQDGAIFGYWLFRMETLGVCHVYRLDQNPEREVSSFRLDRWEQIVPHSNAVMFGSEYYAPEDEFPLLYSNIYNNYANSEDRMVGACCVYRLRRQGETFTTQLIQLIRVGFVDDTDFWCSQGGDARPYGNFTIDREKGILYAFTMRDGSNATRYFSFRVPQAHSGIADEQWNIPVVTLNKADILEQFDCPYHRFLQGACCHGGKIYSVEGFTGDGKNPPALRMIDPAKGVQECYVPFSNFGMDTEQELIDFYGEVCYYSDCKGNLYVISF